MSTVFVTGATGYLGSRLVPALLDRGHAVKALVRAGGRVDARCEMVRGEALDPCSFAAAVAGCDTLVHLVGTPKPAPWKAREFRRVDVGSVAASIDAARRAGGVRHFVYVSVARPAPVMKAYQQARAEAEQMLAAAGWDRTILRPWYVLGPGHWWPLALTPLYAAAEWLPATRLGARRLALVRVKEMVGALVRAVEEPARGCRILEPAAIRAATYR